MFTLCRRVMQAGLAVSLFLSIPASAETEPERFGAGGYFRVMTRPDLSGGDSKLGFYNLYGRLMNEGPYAALEMRLNLLQKRAASQEPWTSLHAKVEGGSVANADRQRGALSGFSLTQLYLKSGNVGLRGVTWQLGTLDSYFGDLGLYDMKPAQIFFDTVGLSARWESKNVDVLVGAGDAGYFLRGTEYDTIFSGGGSVRVRLAGGHLELGTGGQVLHEPKVEGNRFAPYATPQQDWTYEDFVRKEVAKSYFEANPGTIFPPSPTPQSSTSWKAIGYLGFGKLGPLRWNNLFVNYLKKHPENFYTETYLGPDGLPNTLDAGEGVHTIYTRTLTDERYQLNVGNEMQVTVVPDRLDLAWGMVYGNYTDSDNDIVPSDDDQTFYSTVLRAQLYMSETVHLLAETSMAKEISRNGNRYREHVDSIFQNDDGIPDVRGLEFGDAAERNTWQGKFGVVLNPLGYGVFTRPSIRILYGAQYSNQTNAFGNSFSSSLADDNYLGAQERHWHHVVGAEAEAWF